MGDIMKNTILLFLGVLPLFTGCAQNANTRDQALTLNIAPSLAQTFKVTRSGGDSVSEGQTLDQDLFIQSQNFPTGPFQIQSSAPLPSGFEISVDPSNPNHLQVHYAPSFDVVQDTDAYDSEQDRYYLNLPLNLSIQTPDGRMNSLNDTIIVYDVRQAPTISDASFLSKSINGVVFHLVVSDLNGEAAPTLTEDAPSAGNLTSTVLVSLPGEPGRLPNSDIEVRWTGLTSSAVGIPTTLHFHACSLGNNPLCTEKDIVVTPTL